MPWGRLDQVRFSRRVIADFFFLLTRFAPLILVGLLYALVDRRLSRNKVSRCCQLQQKTE